MRKHKKAWKMVTLLASVLIIDSFAGYVLPCIESYAYTEKPATVNASSLNVRSGPGTTYPLVTKLTSGAAVTVIDEKTAADGALWYQIRINGANGTIHTGYVSKSYLKFPAAYINDGDFEAKLVAEGFPESYKTKLRTLHAQYPKWVFRAQKTNLDWNSAIKEESQVGRTLVSTKSMSSWKSIADGAFNWDNSTWTGFDGSAWVSASEDIVKYYMDPRNFLDETNVFQFLTQTYDSNSHTLEGLQTMVKGTFLEGTASGGTGGTGNNSNATDNAVGGSAAPSGSSSGEVSLEGPHASITPKNPFVLMEYGPGANMAGPGADGTGTTKPAAGSTSYVDIIMNAGTQSGVNPYVLAAMIIQEQGTGGTGGSISGTEAEYAGVYNFFNIEAYQSGSMSAVQRGLWWASQAGSYERPWNSPEKSILGGSLFYGNNYVKVGQDTFYLKKYNVQGSNAYKHQYMTNVQGAASEGAFYAKAYNDEMKKTALEFKIPIYNNMPDNPCGQPTQDGSPNNKLSSLGVDGFVMTPTYNRDILEYNLIVNPSVSSVTVNASVLDSTAVVGGIGTIQLQNGTNDVKITVTAKNGSVRNYVIHVVRQENGPTYSSAGGAAGSNPGATAASGSSEPGGASQTPSGGGGGSNITPGGSNVTIVPDSSATKQ